MVFTLKKKRILTKNDASFVYIHVHSVNLATYEEPFSQYCLLPRRYGMYGLEAKTAFPGLKIQFSENGGETWSELYQPILFPARATVLVRARYIELIWHFHAAQMLQ